MPTLDWIGKKTVADHHRQVPFHLLRENASLSTGDPASGNLLVQGDNLLALKALLPYYAGRVKCIYIDPPYNTGNEAWVYNDNVNAPEIRKWLGEVVGREAEDLSRHDKWLCMMYPRLALLREFLRHDGVICVSIDDEESGYLRLLLDEVFGRNNFIANIVWQKRYVSNVTAKYLSDMHDHILVYGRLAANVRVHLVPRTDEQKGDYKNPDNDPRGPWRAQDLSASKPYSAGQFTIIGPNGDRFDPPPNRYWRMNRAQYEAWLADGRITFGKSGKGRPMLKRFLSEAQEGLTPHTWWAHDFAGHNKEATLELKALFGGRAPFDTPKPVRLLRRVLQIFSSPGDVVLDSFAGSGTTGHAVLQLNVENPDTPPRRFILCEMESEIARGTTAERLKRVSEGYGETPGLGGGFRFCELGPTLFGPDGRIRPVVTFEELARHVFFTETGQPLSQGALNGTPLLGVVNGTAVYLLYNGILKDKSPNGGNVLTREVLSTLPPHDGPKVIYGTSRRVSPEALRRASIAFRQIPYEIRTS